MSARGAHDACRPFRHLPGRHDAAVGRLRRDQAAGGRRRRGGRPGGADLLRAAGVQLRRPRRRHGAGRQGHCRVRGLRLPRRAVGLVQRHDPHALRRPPRRRSRARRARAGAGREDLRADRLPRQRAEARQGSRALRRAPSPTTTPAPACARWASRRSRARCSPRCRASSSRRWRSPRPAAASAAPSRSSSARSRRGWPTTSASTSPTAAPKTVVLGDMGCLLNMEGRMRRRGDESTQFLHVAEVLAGEKP